MKTSLFQISNKFDKIYFDNCSLRYKARNMSNDKAMQNPLYIDSYINYIKQIKNIISIGNGIIINDIYIELKGYINYLKSKNININLIKEYEDIIDNYKIDYSEYEIVNNIHNEKLSDIDIKLISIIISTENTALVTNDIELIKECISKSLKNRIITRFNFKDYYILSDKMYIFEKLK